MFESYHSFDDNEHAKMFLRMIFPKWIMFKLEAGIMFIV
jgi:hypothetical protein